MKTVGNNTASLDAKQVCVCVVTGNNTSIMYLKKGNEIRIKKDYHSLLSNTSFILSFLLTFTFLFLANHQTIREQSLF